MEYRGYTAKVEFDSDAKLFHGKVLDLRDVITFQGTSVAELEEEFRASVDDYLEWCAERGEEPEKPFSGKFVVRLEPHLHRDIATRAALAGQSLNAWVADALAAAVKPPKQVPPVQDKSEGEYEQAGTILSTKNYEVFFETSEEGNPLWRFSRREKPKR